MVTKATPAQAHALGFTTPQGTDLIRDGDNAISNNALTAAAYVLQLRAAAAGDPLPALPDPTGLEWVDVTLTPGYAFRSGQPVQVALDRFGLVHLRGHMDATGFVAQSGPQAFATVPAWAKPDTEVRWLGFSTGSAGNPFGGWIAASDGTMYLYPDSASAVPVGHFAIIAQAWPAAGGGAAIDYNQRGTGSPLGVLTPAAAGITYTDTAATTGARQWISTGTTPADWTVTVGDTGWRDISSLLRAGWTASAVLLRRVNNVGILSVTNLAGTSNPALDEIPAGFRSSTPGGSDLIASNSTNVANPAALKLRIPSSGSAVYFGSTVSLSVAATFEVSWITGDIPWPTD